MRPNTPVEPFAREAAAENAALVGAGTCCSSATSRSGDDFGRLLRYVWVESTGDEPPLFVNFELVARGFANAATYPPDVRTPSCSDAAEREARQWGRGLWSDAGVSPSALPPGE